MRILVASDTHGDEWALLCALEKQPSARVVLFLGDGAREAQEAAERFPNREFHIVAGNNDWGAAGLASAEVLPVAEHRLFLTHGHCYGVKTGLYRLECAARERGCDVALFGHTHEPLAEYTDGLYLFNPGSLHGMGTYGLLDITDAGVVPLIVEARR